MLNFVYTQRACPVGGPKGPLRPQAARGCWRGGEEGGVTPPKKKFHQIFFFAKNSAEGATAAAGLQGVLEGGVTPPQKKVHKKIKF